MDDLAPVEWRFWLASRLEEYAKRFGEIRKPDDRGTMCQNAGFVYQAQAEEEERQGTLLRARAHLMRALKWYREAWQIRTRLVDPRMVAQTEVRLGESYVLSARIDCRPGHWEKASRTLARAQECAAHAETIYAQIPQEGIRLDHVLKLRENMEVVWDMIQQNAP